MGEPEITDQIDAAPAECRRFGSFSIGEIWLLFWGKVRRFYYGHFRKDYVRKQEAIRQFECARCGACCHLLYRCPFLEEQSPGFFSCSIHKTRPVNCRIYPVDKADLADREILAPDRPCGYRFPD